MIAPVLNFVMPSLRSWSRLPMLEKHLSVEEASRFAPAVWWDYERAADGQNRYPLLDNGTEGDCVIAWELHYIESGWRRLVSVGGNSAANSNVPDVIATAGQANAAYWEEVDRQSGGSQPQVPPGPGLDPVQAVIDWKNYGLQCATERNFAAGAVSLTSQEPALVRSIAYTCAGLGLVLELPDNYAALAADPQQIWTPSGPPDPSLGHMAFLSGFAGNRVGIKSWGQAYTATWSWVFTYCVGMIAVLTSDWVERLPAETVSKLEAEVLSLGGSKVF